MAAGEGDYGYDALNDKFGNLMAQGICDPTKVIVL
jgi:chaperonin GroEL (HSP60 family)